MHLKKTGGMLRGMKQGVVLCSHMASIADTPSEPMRSGAKTLFKKKAWRARGEQLGSIRSVGTQRLTLVPKSGAQDLGSTTNRNKGVV